jgi:hypothetical protein
MFHHSLYKQHKATHPTQHSERHHQADVERITRGILVPEFMLLELLLTRPPLVLPLPRREFPADLSATITRPIAKDLCVAVCVGCLCVAVCVCVKQNGAVISSSSEPFFSPLSLFLSLDRCCRPYSRA